MRFLTESTCECPFHGNCLSKTSFLFIVPSFLLFEKGDKVMGFACLSLAATSHLYHSTHSPHFRAADVITIYILSFLAAKRVYKMESFPLSIFLVSVGVASQVMSESSLFHREGRLRIECHILMHVASSMALCLL